MARPDHGRERRAKTWCTEVNGRTHSETYALPGERLGIERGVLRPVPLLRPPLRAGELRKVDRLGMVRFGSGRYAVPEHLIDEDVEIMAHDDVVVIRQAGAEIIRHTAVGPGEVALGTLADAHRSPTRGVRPRTAAEVAFLGLGPAAETFLRTAAAAGHAEARARAARDRRTRSRLGTHRGYPRARAHHALPSLQGC